MRKRRGGGLTIVADNVTVGQHLFEVEDDALGGLEEPELCLELEGTSGGGEGGLSGGGGAVGLEDTEDCVAAELNHVAVEAVDGGYSDPCVLV